MRLETKTLRRACLGLGALFVLAVAGACASTTVPQADAVQAWRGLDDCFSREIALPAPGLDRMARTCSGRQAVGDPTRTGIERANAAFNAARAFNALGEGAAPATACDPAGDCYAQALAMIEQSYASQSDDQMRAPADPGSADRNQRFKLARVLAHGRALGGLAATAPAPASCGDPTACLTTASIVLEAADLDQDFLITGTLGDPLLCDLLNLRSGVNDDLGGIRMRRVRADLNAMVRLCPSMRPAATDRLAELSFEDAEQVRIAMLTAREAGTSSNAQVQAALGAIEDYRDAMNAPRLRQSAESGIGALYRELARMVPAAQAESYLASAVAAFEHATLLASTSGDGPGEARARFGLGEALIALAATPAYQDTDDQVEMLEDAALALERSVALDPAPETYLKLAEARAGSGALDQASAAYRAAIPGLAQPSKARAQLALAGVLDQMGAPQAALDVLEQAAAEGSDLVEVHYEIGRRRFATGNYDAAKRALARAVDAPATPQNADANYLLSITETLLQAEGWQARSVRHAERAVQAGAGAPKYARQACLAHILRGGRAVQTGSTLSWCTGMDTPEGYLLAGMYLLKQAQSLDVSAYNLASQTRWRNVLSAAEDTFRQGQDALAGAPDAARSVYFDDLRREVDLSKALDQGLTVVRRCRRDVTIEPGDAAWNDLQAFFGRYGVLRCS